MQLVTIDETARRTAVSDGPTGTTELYAYYGKAGGFQEGPQAYLVDMVTPGGRIDAHYHDIDQFQVVGRGHGRLGARALKPVALHYADAFTPYGPIVASQEGMAFYTIRNMSGTGYWAMPENKATSKRDRYHIMMFDIERPLPAAGQSEREVIWDGNEDRLRVVGLRIGAGAEIKSEPSDGGGQYLLVCDGTVTIDGKNLPQESMIRVEAGEEAPVIKTGAAGAQVLVMQFGKTTARLGSGLASRAFPPPKEYKLPAGTKVA